LTIVKGMERLREILAEVFDLQHAASLLSWDQDTYMPAGGVRNRAEQLATLRRVAHQRFTSPEVGELLEQAESDTQALDDDSHERRLVTVTRRDYEKSRRLPAELVAQLARSTSEARPAWIRARRESDWGHFAPHLVRNVALNQQVAELLGYEGHPYDALLDRNEPGMTHAQLTQLFADLKQAVVPLLSQIAERTNVVDDACLHRQFDAGKQLAFALAITERFGYDLERGRMDLTAHPFCTGFGRGDVRITTRVYADYLSPCLFGTMHESGHAMYNQGIDARLDRTPLWAGSSPGMHESQSRLWENLVGRSRGFWRWAFPQLQAIFPDALGGVEAEGFYRAVNKVQPSFIRVEADELTYNLHILLRFELENELLESRLSVADLPEAWRQKMRTYVGVEPPDDRRGPLQDVHWTGVSFGGFPSYTLGNVIGAQLMKAARSQLPDVDEQIERGDFAALLYWLQENVYRHGRKFTPGELLERATGAGLSARPWIEYAQAKFSELYGLAD
jgi:carboxypeptidase Taq